MLTVTGLAVVLSLRLQINQRAYCCYTFGDELRFTHGRFILAAMVHNTAQIIAIIITPGRGVLVV